VRSSGSRTRPPHLFNRRLLLNWCGRPRPSSSRGFSGRCGGSAIAGVSIITIGQALNLKLFSNSKERVQILLRNIDFSVIDEVQNGNEIIVGYAPKVNVRVGVLVGINLLTEGGLEEIRAC